MPNQETDAIKIAADVVGKAADVAQKLLNTTHEQALSDAKGIVDEASTTAQALLRLTHEKSVEVASDALRRVFGENEEAKRFIDVSRIPLICKAIVELNERSVENRVWQKGQATMMKLMIGIMSAIGLAVLGLGTTILEKLIVK